MLPYIQPIARARQGSAMATIFRISIRGELKIRPLDFAAADALPIDARRRDTRRWPLIALKRQDIVRFSATPTMLEGELRDGAADDAASGLR